MTFKKTISFFIFLFVINTISFGQFGIKVGVDFPRFTVELENHGKVVNTAERENVHMSLFYDVKINKRITFIPAFKYSRKKVRYTTPVSFVSQYQFTNLELPLLLKLHTKPINENIKISVLAGTYATFNIRDTELKKLDYGLIYGMGFQRETIQLEVFHSIGIPDLSTSLDRAEYAKMQNIGISVAFLFIRDKNDY